MFGAIREVQIPLLAAMLLGACGAKALRAVRARAVSVGLGPTALFPLRLRRPVAMFMCATEMALGFGLVLTSTRLLRGAPATVVRAGVALLFLIAVGALVELRERRPDAGCGCFGDLSVTPVGLRTIARSALLAVAALATIGQRPLTMPTSSSAAGLRIALLAAELLVIAALSPEIGEAMVRLGYSEPCEVRRVSVERTLSSLGGSTVWRKHADLVTSPAPSDIWREGCWRYVVYPGEVDGRRVEVIFAVYLRSRRPQIRAAILDSVTDEVLAGPNSATWPGDPAGSGWPGADLIAPTGPAQGFLPDLAPTRPMAAPAGAPAGRAHIGGPAGRADMAVPVGRADTAGPADRGAHPADTLVTGGTGALHFAGPAYPRNGPAYTRNGPAYAPDGPDPVAYAARPGGPGQRPDYKRADHSLDEYGRPDYERADYGKADYGCAGRKPDGRPRPGPRRPRHRSSATF